MSTRSVIARPSPEGGFHGTYCHNDGYPAHQGRILFDAVTGNFDGDPDAACRYLIDQHPAGWSVLHGDVTAPPGFRTGHDPQDVRNQCYCHGDRQEPPRPPLTEQTAGDAFIDCAYMLEADRLRVLTNRAGEWQPIAEPAWTERPDWDAIDQQLEPIQAGDRFPVNFYVGFYRQPKEDKNLEWWVTKVVAYDQAGRKVAECQATAGPGSNC